MKRTSQVFGLNVRGFRHRARTDRGVHIPGGLERAALLRQGLGGRVRVVRGSSLLGDRASAWLPRLAVGKATRQYGQSGGI